MVFVFKSSSHSPTVNLELYNIYINNTTIRLLFTTLFLLKKQKLNCIILILINTIYPFVKMYN